MRSFKAVGVSLLMLAAAATSARAEGASLTFQAGYFFPSSSVFKDVYKNGAVFGADLAVRLAGGLHLWAGAEYFAKNGFLTVTEEETKVRIIPVFAGLRYHFGRSGVRPYLGAAAAYFLFHEENPLGTISKNGLGFLGQFGLLFKLAGPLRLDVHANYRVCTLRADGEDPVEAQLGGLAAGGGLSFRF